MRVNANAILSRFALHAPAQYGRGAAVADVHDCRGDAFANCTYAPGPRITCVDQAVIHEYFRECDAGAPAQGSKGKLRELRLCELPAALERRLSKLPAGFERAWKGQDLVVIETDTGRVIDILRGARLAH